MKVIFEKDSLTPNYHHNGTVYYFGILSKDGVDHELSLCEQHDIEDLESGDITYELTLNDKEENDPQIIEFVKSELKRQMDELDNKQGAWLSLLNNTANDIKTSLYLNLKRLGGVTAESGLDFFGYEHTTEEGVFGFTADGQVLFEDEEKDEQGITINSMFDEPKEIDLYDWATLADELAKM